jgi:hypothetical protein
MNTLLFHTGNEGAIISLSEGATMTAAYRATISTGDPKGNNQLVLVGVDANGDDMTDGIIVDKLLPCPPACSIKNVLNT